MNRLALTDEHLRRKDCAEKMSALALDAACQLVSDEYGGDVETGYIAYVEDRCRQAIFEALEGLDFETRADWSDDPLYQERSEQHELERARVF